jgi:ubiquinone biosynthesis protein
VSEEAPDWARTLPQLPRLVHRALTARHDSLLGEQVQLLAARQRRQNRLLAALLGLLAALLVVQLIQLVS